MKAFKGRKHEAESEIPSDPMVAKQKVTLLACWLGLVASIGGFMFGYVRSVPSCAVLSLLA